ncbi:MAG: 50S ribosomal protein L32 [Thermostichus sp. DG_1_6_bins_120]
MAVPKKKTSKSRSRKRYATWTHKAKLQAQRAMTIGRSILTGRNTGFYYPGAKKEEEEEE